MSNEYYTRGDSIQPHTLADARAVSAEFTKIEQAFDRLPNPEVLDATSDVGLFGHYTSTFSEAITRYNVGEIFACDQTGEMYIYKRIEGAPGYTAIPSQPFALESKLLSVGAGKGSSAVAHKSQLGGSVATTVYASLNARRANAMSDFGAAFDGLTIDTAALQAGINAISAHGGGTLELPSGATKTSTLTLPDNVLIEGQGRYATRLVATAGLNAPIIHRAGTLGAVINRGGVTGLAIVGSGKANTGCIGIKNVFTNRGVFRDVDIFGTYRGMWIENVWQDVLDNVHVHGGGSDQSYQGFFFAPKSPTVGVSNAVIANGCMAQGVENVGFRIENGNGSKFSSCEASDGVHGWYIGDPSSGAEATEFMQFANCLGDTTSGHVWRIERGGATSLRKLAFANCWAGSSLTGSGAYIAGASELTFAGWQLASMNLHGFHFNQSSRCMVSGSNIRDWNKASGASNGVHLEDSLVIKVVGCDIYTTTLGTGKGFAEVGLSDFNALVASNASGGWSLTGAGSTQSSNTMA